MLFWMRAQFSLSYMVVQVAGPHPFVRVCWRGRNMCSVGVVMCVSSTPMSCVRILCSVCVCVCIVEASCIGLQLYVTIVRAELFGG